MKTTEDLILITFKEILARITERSNAKLTSGRFLLTIAAAIAFIMLVMSYVNGGPSISSDAMTGIMTGVFTFYFLKGSGTPPIKPA